MARDLVEDSKTQQPPELKRTLGTAGIVFMVVAGAAPLTVIAGILPLVLLTGNGIGAPVNYLIAGLVLIVFSVGFTTMSHHIKNAGAFFSYIQKGLGRIPGIAAASLALITYALLLVGVFAYFGESTRNAVLTMTGVDIAWWVYTLAGIALVAFLGFRNVEMSAKVLGLLLIAELLVVIIVDFAIIVVGGEGGLRADPLLPQNVFTNGFGIGFMFAIFGFIGFEATAAFRNEAKDPNRTIPRATYISVTIIALFYAFSAWVFINGIGVDSAVEAANEDPVGLVHDLGAQYAGAVVHDIMQVLLATSFFACVLTFHNVISRYLFTLGKVGVLPGALASVHKKHFSPWFASSVTAVVTAVLVIVFALPGFDPVIHIYTWMSGAATLGLTLLMSATSVAVLVFFAKNPQFQYSVWRTKIAPAIAVIGLGTAMVLIIINFEFLIGSMPLAITFAAVIVIFILGGIALGYYLKSRKPETYAELLKDEED